MRRLGALLMAFGFGLGAHASQGAEQAGPPKVTAQPALESDVDRTLPPGTEVDLILQSLLAAGTAMADDRFEAVAVTAKVPPDSMRPLTAATARGFLSSVRRPGPKRSALTLSFEELHAGPKPQRLRASVIQVFQGPKPDQSGGDGTAALYRGLQPLPGVLVDIPGTVTSVDGNEVRLPPGTVLRVRLEQPVTVRMPGLQTPATPR
jgi:hypothetical protein